MLHHHRVGEVHGVAGGGVAGGAGRRAERGVADGYNAVRGHKIEEFRLLKVRVQLHFIARQAAGGRLPKARVSLGTVMLDVPMWRTNPSSTSRSICRQVCMNSA